jgi:hypothetical protein
LDEQRRQQEPEAPPFELDLEIPKYEEVFDKARQEKEKLVLEFELKNSDTIEKDKSYKQSLRDFELLKVIDKFLSDYDGRSIVKIKGQIYLVELMAVLRC